MEYVYDTREHLGWALYPRLAAFLPVWALVQF